MTVCIDGFPPWQRDHNRRRQISLLPACLCICECDQHGGHHRSCIWSCLRKDYTNAPVHLQPHRNFYKYRPWVISFSQLKLNCLGLIDLKMSIKREKSSKRTPYCTLPRRIFGVFKWPAVIIVCLGHDGLKDDNRKFQRPLHYSQYS